MDKEHDFADLIISFIIGLSIGALVSFLVSDETQLLMDCAKDLSINQQCELYTVIKKQGFENERKTSD